MLTKSTPLTFGVFLVAYVAFGFVTGFALEFLIPAGVVNHPLMTAIRLGTGMLFAFYVSDKVYLFVEKRKEKNR